jgi:hypothetical protein
MLAGKGLKINGFGSQLRKVSPAASFKEPHIFIFSRSVPKTQSAHEWAPGLVSGARAGARPRAPGARRGSQGAENRPKNRGRIYHVILPQVCPERSGSPSCRHEPRTPRPHGPRRAKLRRSARTSARRAVTGPRRRQGPKPTGALPRAFQRDPEVFVAQVVFWPWYPRPPKKKVAKKTLRHPVEVLGICNQGLDPKYRLLPTPAYTLAADLHLGRRHPEPW